MKSMITWNIFGIMEKNRKKIYDGIGSVDTFKKMYENVDVVIDTTIFLFWEEIFGAFLEAKVTWRQ